MPPLSVLLPLTAFLGSPYAHHLEGIGLADTATVIREQAEETPPLAARVLSDPNRANVKARLASHHRRGELWPPGSYAYLEENADDELLDFMDRSRRTIRRRKL